MKIGREAMKGGKELGINYKVTLERKGRKGARKALLGRG